MDINATQEIWSFVSKYNLNGLIDCNTSIINQFNIINNKKNYNDNGYFSS